ncbi:MAG: hypothetical protein J6U01_00885, partial [Clostridia bacterium]|nr:hypothetical protein [Clostridia bacterium]
WIKGMETVGNTASSIANNTRFKVDEMNLQNQRREIVGNIGSMAYVLWQKGEHFPEEIGKQLQEVQRIDELLNDMRAERYAGKSAVTENIGEAAPAKKPDPEPLPEAEKESCPVIIEAPGKTEGEELPPVQPSDGKPVTSSIEALFSSDKDVQQLADKVRDSLERMDSLKDSAAEKESGAAEEKDAGTGDVQ